MATLSDRVAARFAALRDVRPFTWKGDVASFEIDGTVFEAAFKGRTITHPTHGRISGFEGSFYKRGDKGAPWMYKPTGEGKALPVFATVTAIVKHFLVHKKPPFVWFVADEATRVRLYNMLIRRMVVPGYEAEVTGEGMYTLRRTKSVFE